MWFYFRKRDLFWMLVKAIFVPEKEKRKVQLAVADRPGIAKVRLRKPMDEKMFEIPIILTVPATSYAEALKQAEATVDELSKDAGLGLGVVTYFEHDNIGQRVLYLHPEEDPDYEHTEDEDDNGD